MKQAKAMEFRARRDGRQASPEISKVWMDYCQSPQQQMAKVPVVYYLSRYRQLDHPHFIEVPLSSPDGLYLRDVIDRLNVLRGNNMPAMYTWSCKRSYKNGFVWHDLGEDDLVIPAHGNDYILKGSELSDQSPSGNNSRTLNTQQEPPTYMRTQEGQGLVEYKVCKTNKFVDASTQTEEKAESTASRLHTCSKGVSTNDETIVGSENGMAEISTAPATPSAPPPVGRMNTLESLIKAEASRMNSFRTFEEEEEVLVPMKAMLKIANMLMQLITCGSISVKDQHNFEPAPTCKSGFSHMKSPSPLPMPASSRMLEELDNLSEDLRVMGERQDEGCCSSGSSMTETKQHEEELEDSHIPQQVHHVLQQIQHVHASLQRIRTELIMAARSPNSSTSPERESSSDNTVQNQEQNKHQR